MINPLIKRRVVSVEEMIEGVLRKLTAQKEVSFFYLTADAQDRTELIATFMGILELIKIRRILICADEEEEFSITTKFCLNEDYTPEESENEITQATSLS